MNSPTCLICKEKIDSMYIMSHVPTCYNKKCNELDIAPLCTCITCGGRKTHDGDKIKPRKTPPKEPVKSPKMAFECDL